MPDCRRAVLVVRLAAALAMLPASAWAASQPQIDQAVQAGAKFLKTQQAANGTWAYKEYDTGGTALAALALLESGVAPYDPALAAARQAIVARAREIRHTYSIALSILFLDRLADREGRSYAPVIAGLGNRLLTGQLDNGRWSYYCPRDQNPIGDNSNTQFALLALWAAGKSGVNVAAALDRVGQMFRATQYPVDGGWQYYDFKYTFPPQKCPGCGYPGCTGFHPASDPASTASMTCAGLLGLAVWRGHALLQARGGSRPTAKNAATPLVQDPTVVAGLKCLSGLRDANAGDLYFLWSLERVGVILGIKEIGGDWHQWGADLLVRSQAQGGGWTDSMYGQSPAVGTSFALLFLRRSDLVPELTETLRRQGQAATHSDGTVEARSAQDKPSTALPPNASAGLSQEKDTLERLLEELPTASEKRQGEILGLLRDAKGNENTAALLTAQAQLKGRMKQAAADALEERGMRMTSRTLGGWMASDEKELRLAAIRAAARKQSREVAPALIEALGHEDAATWRAAKQSLAKLTGEDFGPAANASPAQRAAAQKAWRSWWDQQGQTNPARPARTSKAASSPTAKAASSPTARATSAPAGYRVVWEFDATKGIRLPSGEILIPVPSGETYQEVRWEIVGVAGQRAIKSDEGGLIAVRPAGARFRLLAAIETTNSEVPRKNGKAAPPPDALAALRDSQSLAARNPQTAKLASQLKAKDPTATVENIRQWITKNMTYRFDPALKLAEAKADGGIDSILAAKRADCGGHSNLFAALCLEAGVPARVIWGAAKMYVPTSPEERQAMQKSLADLGLPPDILQRGDFCSHARSEVFLQPWGWIPIELQDSQTNLGQVPPGDYVSFLRVSPGAGALQTQAGLAMANVFMMCDMFSGRLETDSASK